MCQLISVCVLDGQSHGQALVWSNPYGYKTQRNRGERQEGLHGEDGLVQGSRTIPYVSRLKAFKKNENVALCQHGAYIE